jgi:hypothetical protein
MDDPKSLHSTESGPDAATPEKRVAPAAGWSRRRVLTGLAGGVAALMAACGRQRAKPTPTPSPLVPTVTPTPTQVGRSSLLPPPSGHHQYAPWVPNDTSAAVALAPEPTLTPTPPKATDTPEPPTPTPTPPATPFPPGPPSKLGLFVARNHPQVFDLLKTGGVAVLKTLELDRNFVREIKATSPRTKVIGRLPHLEQVSLAGLDATAAARAFVEELLPYADDPERSPWFDGWEAYNEPVAANPDEMARLADFEAERTRLLAERGIRSVIGNFGTGQPPMELWEAFLPAVQAAKQYDGWLGLHEYSAPTMYYLTTRENQGRYPGVSPDDSGWLTLRYRQVYNQTLIPRGLAIPLVFTELGVDGLVANRPGPLDGTGWQHFQDYWAQNGYGLWGPGAYVEQLVWFDEAMRQNDYVLGGCIYALAGSSGWEAYDILGPAAAVLQQYLSVHAAA